jgi:dihydrolipoamide dehydrogenase
MKEVRKLRDRFVRGVTGDIASWTDTHLISKRATFVDKNTLDLGDERITADHIVIATGSSPITPGPWKNLSKYFFDSDSFFELETLPQKVAVIGMGVIGLELGQALSRLGVEVVGINIGRATGGLTSPEMVKESWQHFSSEMQTDDSGVESLEEKDGKLVVSTKNNKFVVDRAFLTLGRSPNVRGLGLEHLDVPTDRRGVPEYDPSTFLLPGTNIALVGDVTGSHALLHEASDEGRIAGYNAVREKPQCFQRRTSLGITFSEPNIATIGSRHQELTANGSEFVTGSVSYKGQGRAIVKHQEVGRLEVYVDKNTHKLVGAEVFAPDGEHLAHLIAWAISANLSVYDALSLPFYHPVIEEGLRTALRDAAKQISDKSGQLELLRCQDPPVGG